MVTIMQLKQSWGRLIVINKIANNLFNKSHSLALNVISLNVIPWTGVYSCFHTS